VSQRDVVLRLKERFHIYGDSIYDEAAVEIERLRGGQIVAEVEIERLRARIEAALLQLDGVYAPDWIRLKLTLLGRHEEKQP
jgi:hypothetical protein